MQVLYVKSLPLSIEIAWNAGIKHVGLSCRTCIIWRVNSDRSIIVEYCKGKQTYLHSLSLKNQILRYIPSIAYNNIYSLTLCGKEIAIILEMDFTGEGRNYEKSDD